MPEWTTQRKMRKLVVTGSFRGLSLCVRVCPARETCEGCRLSDCSVSGVVRDGRDGRWLPEALSPMWEGVRPALQPPAPHPNSHRRAAVPLSFLPLCCIRTLPSQVPRRPPSPHRVCHLGGLARALPPPPLVATSYCLVLASVEKIRRPGRSWLELDSRKRSHEARIRTPRGLLTRNHLHANFPHAKPGRRSRSRSKQPAGPGAGCLFRGGRRGSMVRRALVYLERKRSPPRPLTRPLR